MEIKLYLLNIAQVICLWTINHLSKSKIYGFIAAALIGISIGAKVMIKSYFINGPMIIKLSNILFSTFAFTFFATYIYIKKHKNQFQQPISKFIKKHAKKKNIPSVGGLIFVLSFIVHSLYAASFERQHYFIILCTFFFACIGFLDDFIKLYYKHNKGISAKGKFVLQALSSISLTILFHYNLGYIQILWWAFVIIGTANAVNLTDGLDGLATICSIIPMSFLTAWHIYSFGMNSSAILLLIIICSLLAFLHFNSYPAKIFMGDTGSMALGAFIATNYLVIQKEWILILTGSIFVLETLSVIIQITSIKLFNRKIFIMTPIHHHFEHYFHEKTITKIFALFMLLTNLGVLLFL